MKTKIPSLMEFDVVTINNQGQEIQKEGYNAQYITENLKSNISLEMVYIPGGKFMMGSSESQQQEVTVPSFFMGKFQITQAQWRAIASCEDLKVKRDLEPDPSNFNPSNFKGDERPVEKVTWDEAVEFCQRLSRHTGTEYRLPSEAEWEYACRAGTTTPFHFGETITSDLANYHGNYTYANEPKGEYRKQTTSVGSFLPNAFGLYDMHGNVWEWCQDNWHDNYQGAQNDGSAWVLGLGIKKVIRGGSWDYYPLYCRSAYRDDPSRDARVNGLGFRVVRVAPSAT